MADVGPQDPHYSLKRVKRSWAYAMELLTRARFPELTTPNSDSRKLYHLYQHGNTLDADTLLSALWLRRGSDLGAAHARAALNLSTFLREKARYALSQALSTMYHLPTESR